MYTSKRKLSNDYVKRAYFLTTGVLTVLFTAIFFIFWHIQIVKNEYYTDFALKNITKTIDLMAPRGVVKDRRGVVLSENMINFTLNLIRENVTDWQRTMQSASLFSGRTKEQIQKTMDRFRNYPKFFWIPIRSNLPMATVVFIESRQDEFPEFKVNTAPLRSYPYHRTAAHVLGYISEILNNELAQGMYRGYKIGDLIGRSGIEKQYEVFLQGEKGWQVVFKDNLERVQQVVKTQEPMIGGAVTLTLDLPLQQFVEQLFDQENGVAGVMDLKSGGLLALVSKPDFDPELFANVMDIDTWQSIANDPENPLQNKFIQGLYSPGSTFKIVMTLAALQEKVITPDSYISCSGSVIIYDRPFHCWNSFGHGSLNIYGALENSCNVFFYTLGKKIEVDTIARYAQLLGLGCKPAIDLPHTSGGLVPSTGWKLQLLGQKWFPGETISLAIGGGALSVSPAQLLQLIATVALRGQMPRMHVLERVEKNGREIFRFTPHFDSVAIDKRYFEVLIEGLHRVVNGLGTGRAASVPGLDICGKTGTSQIISMENPNYRILVKEKQFRPHSWFVSFAPRSDPQIAMVILVENGGDAGSIAAPLAQQIYRYYFKK